jgi:hypothetical protein
MPVFISHSQMDYPSYSSLCLALDGANVARWDPTELAAGESLAEQLRRAIVQCHVCIFLATAQSLDSHWCLAELGAFWGAGKKVIIYLADPGLKESDIPPQFQGTLCAKDAKQLLSSVIRIMNDAAEVSNSFNAEPLPSIASDGPATGVRGIFRNRLALDLNHNALNEKINSANVVNIASLVFNVQQSRDLKKSLELCVRRGGRVRILLSDLYPAKISGGQISNSSKSAKILWPLRLRQYAEKDLDHKRLPTELRDMMQIDTTMIVTFYCNKQQGNGSPTLRLERTSDERCLFVLFEEEFNYLWETAKPVSQL